MRYENARAIDYAIIAMVKKGELVHQESRKILYRQVWISLNLKCSNTLNLLIRRYLTL